MSQTFNDWLTSWGPQTHEVIPGLLSGQIPYGGLSDPDLQPGAPITAGGYAEERREYESAIFAPTDGSEPRTVHLGIDVFAAAGAPVRAPLDGVVHSFADNQGAGNYGPTIILEHAVAPDLTFHILFGHLSGASLDGLQDGDRIAAGDQFAQLGDRDVNGDWSPHLHFQIILDIGDARADFPGVCKRSERETWLARCPDPARLLGLQSN